MKERFKYLFERYLEKRCTAEEKRELSALALAPGNEHIIAELMEQCWGNVYAGEDMPEENAAAMFSAIVHTAPAAIPMLPRRSSIPAWMRVAAAAAIIVLLGIGTWLVFFSTDKQQQVTGTKPAVHDVPAPGINRAMITLADGKTIFLDSVNNGALTTQGNVKLVKLANGQIAYQAEQGGLSREVQYNTLFNPRGSKVIDMILSDGSHVWLNAGSSLTYPVAFAGNERKVSITGEAYFEITHNAVKPFYVSKGEMQVEVLGTHFNVNAYDDEDEIKVTLLEGSVKVTLRQSQGDRGVTIKPGEQAQLTTNHQLQTTNQIDLDEVMAWKNGRFEFRGNSIQSVMKQVERWYDVEVIYEGKISTEQFVGATSRQENVSALLKVLEATDKVHFKIEGKKVIVMQ